MKIFVILEYILINCGGRNNSLLRNLETTHYWAKFYNVLSVVTGAYINLRMWLRLFITVLVTYRWLSDTHEYAGI